MGKTWGIIVLDTPDLNSLKWQVIWGAAFPSFSYSTFLLNLEFPSPVLYPADQVSWLHCLATQTFRRQFTLTPYWFGKGVTTPDNPKFFQRWERFCHLAFFRTLARRGHCHGLLICSLNHFSHLWLIGRPWCSTGLLLKTFCFYLYPHNICFLHCMPSCEYPRKKEYLTSTALHSGLGEGIGVNFFWAAMAKIFSIYS